MNNLTYLELHQLRRDDIIIKGLQYYDTQLDSVDEGGEVTSLVIYRDLTNNRFYGITMYTNIEGEEFAGEGNDLEQLAVLAPVRTTLKTYYTWGEEPESIEDDSADPDYNNRLYVDYGHTLQSVHELPRMSNYEYTQPIESKGMETLDFSRPSRTIRDMGSTQIY